MAIKASRMESFSRDFNAPVLDFKTARDVKDVFNIADSAKDTALTALADAKSIASQIQSNAMDLLGESKEFLSDLTREAKGQFDKIVDLANVSEKAMKGLIDDVFSGFPKSVIDAVKSVGTLCRNNAIGAGMGAGRKFMSNPSCGNFSAGAANCPPSSTKGLLGSIGSDVNRALKRGLDAIGKAVTAVASLLGMGYSANLCNVLTSVMGSTGIGDVGILGVAAASVLNQSGLKGSVNAVLDIAKSSIGNLAALAPSAIKNTAKNLALGTVLNSKNIKQASDGILTSFGLVDKNWAGDIAGKVNVGGLGLNPDFKKVTDFTRKTSTFDLGSLSTATLSRDEQIYAGVTYNSENTVSNNTAFA